MNWLRLYHSTLESRKVQTLPDREFKAWVNLLIIASKNTPRGQLPSLSDLAFTLRLREDFVTRLISKFTRDGLVDNTSGILTMHDWDEHQFGSDDVNTRVKTYRERKRNVTRNVTQNDTCINPDSDTDSDTDTDSDSLREPTPENAGPTESEPETEAPTVRDASKVITLLKSAGKPSQENAAAVYSMAMHAATEMGAKHPYPGGISDAAIVLDQILETATDPEQELARIRSSHDVWVPYWTVAKANGEIRFIPNISQFFRDKLYLQKPPDRQRANPQANGPPMRMPSKLDVLDEIKPRSR